MVVDVIGVDPSITATGIATGAGLVAVGGSADCGDDRLTAIYVAVYALAEDVELAVLEDLPKHAYGAGITGMAQGVVRLAMSQRRIPVVAVPPTTLKVYATGSGVATKADMRVELLRRTGKDVRDDNQADAWWLRALGFDMLGAPLLALPQTHRRALDKLPSVLRKGSDHGSDTAVGRP